MRDKNAKNKPIEELEDEIQELGFVIREKNVDMIIKIETE